MQVLYMDLTAQLKVKPQQQAFELPSSSAALISVRDFKSMHLPFVDLPIDRSGTYNKIVSPQFIYRRFELVGGRKQPKKIQIEGSDGHSYFGLVKRDDLRQDLLAQNVFELSNYLMSTDKVHMHLDLKVPTYMVIPTSTQAGIIEWVSDCVPVGKWLEFAHQSIYPDDWKPGPCHRLMIAEFKKPKSSAAAKISVYRAITEHFHPVMRYFFENSSELTCFARENYVKTCAISSVLGYILGISLNFSWSRFIF